MDSPLGNADGADGAMQGWAWRPDRDMKEWCLGGQPDLMIENQDDGPNRDNEGFPEPSIELCVCFFVTSVGNGENVSLLLWISSAPWLSSCAHETRRHVSPRLKVRS